VTAVSWLAEKEIADAQGSLGRYHVNSDADRRFGAGGLQVTVSSRHQSDGSCHRQKSTQPVLDQLKKALDAAQQEEVESDWDECVHAIKKAKLPKK
jgi:hypothetical protein